MSKFNTVDLINQDNDDEEFEDIVDECIDEEDKENNKEGSDVDMDDEAEFEISNFGGTSADDDIFDNIVGALQEIVSEGSFQNMQNEFMHSYCGGFEDTEENKLEYMDIFNKYNAVIESHLEKRLSELLPKFSLEKFDKLLETRKDQIDDQLLELLHSFSDFSLFKEIMLSHKHMLSQVKEYKEKSPEKKTAMVDVDEDDDDLFGTLGISGKKTVIHIEEQSEGEEMPDLMLNIKSIKPK